LESSSTRWRVSWRIAMRTEALGCMFVGCRVLRRRLFGGERVGPHAQVSVSRFLVRLSSPRACQRGL
jgi:hypothetical protein